MATEQCRNCRFSKFVDPGLVCRRYPPLGGDGRFPACDPSDWCGEWMAMRPGAGLPAEIAPPKVPTTGATKRRIAGAAHDR